MATNAFLSLFLLLSLLFQQRLAQQFAQIHQQQSSPNLLDKNEQSLNPIFLVHGFTASKMFVEGQQVEYPEGQKCQQKDTDFHQAWVSRFLVTNQDCEFYWLGLDYDQMTGAFTDRRGVQISVYDRQRQFGDADSIQCLWWDGYAGCYWPYFRPLVKWLKQLGYTEGHNLFGAVYDWRHHPASAKLDSYFEQWKALIEQAVANSGGQKAIVVAHSYGNIIFNHFLRMWTNEEWRQKYIQLSVNVAAPFGGSADAAHDLLIGHAITLVRYPFIPAVQVRDFARSLASPAILLPRTEAFNSSHVFFKIDDDNFEYTVKNMRELLQLAQSSHLWPLHTGHIISDNGNVPMYCVYGTGIQTSLSVHYQSIANFLAGERPDYTQWGDGDGSVNIESLRLCQKWQQSNPKISVKEIAGKDHQNILAATEFLDYLKPILLGQLLAGEHFAIATHPSGQMPVKYGAKSRAKSGTNSSKALLCFPEHKLAKCPEGTKPSRWTRQRVPFVCVDRRQKVGGEEMRQWLRELEEANAAMASGGGQTEEEELERLIELGRREKWLASEGRHLDIPLTCA